jgi:hypothetical protein
MTWLPSTPGNSLIRCLPPSPELATGNHLTAARGKRDAPLMTGYRQSLSLLPLLTTGHFLAAANVMLSRKGVEAKHLRCFVAASAPSRTLS